jgi:hypothetical protein
VSAFAFNELSKLTGADRATMGRFVEAFSPVHVPLFTYQVQNLNAVFGQILVPVMERFRLVVRDLEGAVGSLRGATGSLSIAGTCSGGGELQAEAVPNADGRAIPIPVPLRRPCCNGP